jgi:hypothetical protein
VLPATSVPRRVRRLLARIVDAERPKPPQWEHLEPVADDARLRRLRAELGRELERVARGNGSSPEAPRVPAASAPGSSSLSERAERAGTAAR